MLSDLLLIPSDTGTFLTYTSGGATACPSPYVAPQVKVPFCLKMRENHAEICQKLDILRNIRPFS